MRPQAGSRRGRWTLLAVVAALTLAVLPGCGSEDAGDGTGDDAGSSATTRDEDAQGASSTARPTSDTAGPTLPLSRSRVAALAALRAFRVCLRENGVEVGRPRELIGVTDPDLAAALDVCYGALASTYADAGLRPPGRGLLGSRPVADETAELPDGDFPDPFGLDTADGLYVYATNTADANVPVAHVEGDRLVVRDALPDLPAWTQPGFVWAPAVLARPDGTFVLYYTSHDVASDLQCIGAAAGSAPTGPFVDGSDEPLACPTEVGGAIDASPFVGADGAVHLLYKTDGNCCGIPTVIVTRELTPDGLGFAGDPVELIRNDLAWEGAVAEAPSMTLFDGRHLLIYSGGDWSNESYAVGYAWCDSATGPCEKQGDPVLATDATRAGPGGAETLARDGGLELIYHAWDPAAVGYEDGGTRTVRLTGVEAAADALTTG